MMRMGRGGACRKRCIYKKKLRMLADPYKCLKNVAIDCQPDYRFLANALRMLGTRKQIPLQIMRASCKLIKLVSHWHVNSSRLLRELSRGTFARHSCECRENFHVSRTSRELVAKVLNMFKNWMRIFSPKYFARLSRDCRATVARLSCECREPVAAKFWQIYNAKFSRHSYECRASVARRSHDSLETTCEKLATIWRENKT